MGQFSSQLKQVTEPEDVPPGSRQASPFLQSSTTEMSSLKRHRISSEHVDAEVPVHTVKRQKTGDERESKKTRRARRSIPQHRRGGAIQPSQLPNDDSSSRPTSSHFTQGADVLDDVVAQEGGLNGGQGDLHDQTTARKAEHRERSDEQEDVSMPDEAALYESPAVESHLPDRTEVEPLERISIHGTSRPDELNAEPRPQSPQQRRFMRRTLRDEGQTNLKLITTFRKDLIVTERYIKENDELTEVMKHGWDYDTGMKIIAHFHAETKGAVWGMTGVNRFLREIQQQALPTVPEHKVNPIGQPGPRRRKKAKKQRSSGEVVSIARQGSASAGETALQPPTEEQSIHQLMDIGTDGIPTPPATSEDASVLILEPALNSEGHAEDGSHDEERPKQAQEYGNQDIIVIDDDEPMPVEEDAQAGDEPAYNPRSTGYADATKQISQWLSTQGSPAPPDEVGPSLGSPALVESDHDIQGTSGRRGTVNGPWSRQDRRLANSVFVNIARDLDLEYVALMSRVTKWQDIDKLMGAMLEAFPLRTRDSIREFCRRTYHTKKTRPWTAEEDETLRLQVAELGPKWVEIGDDLNRPAEGCRSRYNDRAKPDAAIEKGPWSLDEERTLTLTVQDLSGPRENEGDDSESDYVSARGSSKIDWSVVASRMGGRRTTRQCKDKWKKLQNRKTIRDTAQRTQEMWKMPKELRRQFGAAYAKLSWRDVYDALTEICDATAADPDRVYGHESTVWSLIAAAHPRSKFASKLRRLCFFEVREMFQADERPSHGVGTEAARLRERLWEWKTVANEDWETSRIREEDGDSDDGQTKGKRRRKSSTKQPGPIRPSAQEQLPAAAHVRSTKPLPGPSKQCQSSSHHCRDDDNGTKMTIAEKYARPDINNKLRDNVNRPKMNIAEKYARPDINNKHRDSANGTKMTIAQKDARQDRHDAVPGAANEDLEPSVSGWEVESPRITNPRLAPQTFIARCKAAIGASWGGSRA